MICRNCGKEIDDNATECIYCGCPTGLEEAVAEDESDRINAEEEYYEEKDTGEELPADGNAEGSEPLSSRTTYVPANTQSSRSGKPGVVSGATLSTAISILCAILSLVCLAMTISIRSAIADSAAQISDQMTEVRQSTDALYSKLDDVDTTIADLTSNTNEQVARQAIKLTKDLNALAGPVTEGKYNQMFIINAQGDLSVTSSFDWQKYNEFTGSWESISFTSDATTNEELGLRFENKIDNSTGTYTSILWANGITQAAAGRYRCVITNVSGVSIRSSEALVEIAVQ